MRSPRSVSQSFEGRPFESIFFFLARFFLGTIDKRRFDLDKL